MTIQKINNPKGASDKLEVATLAGGCFWCIETIFRDLKGVESVVSGYSGGKTENPTYEQVCSGTTGHAEVVQIIFDPKVLSYEKLLEIFFHIHDPTTLNRQGADKGTQYRSAIFYHNESQKKTAEEVIKKITEQKLWDDPIVTEVTKFDVFYSAEDYHQDYYNNNKDKAYCSLVIAPKVRKFYKEYKDYIKDDTGK
ncbi:MAG: peptide-methionine (S)-S-oxide reductase MsrA [Bacteroidetes bacterium]|nr:peptide-methionine (S)-S-oxide reductase MsrA [Bacteroidota bacterium]